MCFKYTVCAVLFGTDNTILNVSLKDGFVFVRRSLIPAIDCLDAVFDTGTMGLRRDYETARIDKDNLDVICIEKHKKVYLEKATSRDWFERQVDDDLVKMDNIIRSIRLFYECPIRYKKISYKMESVDTQSGSIFYSSIIPISESSSTKEISKFHCDPDEILVLSEKILKMSFPIENEILNTAHLYYDLSYHQEKCISITLLFVALEMIFLKEDTGKKERLAKRCSVFMYETENERVDCYNKLKLAYKQRSDFVHDGIRGIEDDTILFLRKCARKAIVSINPYTFNKKAFIDDLKNKVGEVNCWNKMPNR